MTRLSVLGPIILHDTTKDTEKTSGQVLYHNTWDSRLRQSASAESGWIDYGRIREIRLDATVQLARQAVVAPMIHTPWDYKFSKDAPADAVEFVKANLEDKRDIQNAVYGALDFGWAPFEIVYRSQEGQVWIDEFKHKGRTMQEIRLGRESRVLEFRPVESFVTLTLHAEEAATNVEYETSCASPIRVEWNLTHAFPTGR